MGECKKDILASTPVKVNNIPFSWHDGFNAAVSVAVTEQEVSMFEGNPSFMVIDAETGAILREPTKKILKPTPATDTASYGLAQGSPELRHAHRFLEQFAAASDKERLKHGTDEYRRVLKGLDIPIGTDDKADMIKKLEQHLNIPTTATEAQNDNVFVEKFLADFKDASDTKRKSINNDEYQRTLKGLGIRHDEDATKAEMIEQVKDYLSSIDDGDA